MTASMPSRSTSEIVNTRTRELPQSLALARIERADADQDGAVLVDRRQSASGRPRSARRSSRARRSGPCRARCPTASSRACCSRRGRRTRSSPTGPWTRASPPKTPSASEWSPPSTSGSSPARRAGLDVAGDLVADGEDLVEVLGAVVAGVERLDRILDDRAEVVHAESELGEAADEVGVADRGRPHVDAAPALPEVERGAEDGDIGRGAHGATLSLQQRQERLRERLRARRGRRRAGRRPPAAAARRRPPRARAGRPRRGPTRPGRARRRRRGARPRPRPGRARPSRRGARRAPAAARARTAPSAARARRRRTRSPCPRARARAAAARRSAAACH